jgi:hypothetical protein
MINRFKKSLILIAGAAMPLFMVSPAMANVTSNKVDLQAVEQFTESVTQSLSAYHALRQGDVVTGKTKIVRAVRHIDDAVTRDPTLGFAQKSAPELKRELSAIKASMITKDREQLRTELREILTEAGVVVRS